MTQIGILCKTSFSQGMGHLVRQTHVANALRNRGAEIVFYIPDYAPAQNWLDQHGFSRQTQPDPFLLTDRIIESHDLFVLDIQDTPENFIKQFHLHKKSVVSFEDLGEGRNHVNLLIDCNLDENKLVSVPTLFSYPHCVLAPDFATYHLKSRIFKQPLRSALLTFGGTDPHALTSTLAEKLIQVDPGLCLTLLAGPGCKNIDALKTLQMQNEKVTLLESTTQMAQTLFEHDVVFCAGGVTLHEAMAVGTPAFVINQVTHQADKAHHAEQQGAALNLGLAESWDETRLPQILKTGPEVLQKMSQAGKRLIDGKGLERVADAIKALLDR